MNADNDAGAAVKSVRDEAGHPTPRWEAVEARSRLAINPLWLVKLRWAAVLGQLITVLVVERLFGIELDVRSLLSVIAFTAATNVLFHFWCDRLGRSLIVAESAVTIEIALGLVLLLDLCLLTVLLFFTGGAFNPFSLFYLVNLGLSAVLLRPLWAWSLMVFAMGCYAVLLFVHEPFPLGDPGFSAPLISRQRSLDLMRLGQFIAQVTSSAVIVYFVTRLTRDQQRLENELRIIDQRRARSEKLEALGTLAAGAAHELAQPLSTIAVIAKEMQRRLSESEQAGPFGDDMRMMRDEVTRCRDILNRMSAQAGEAVGEPVVRITASQLVEEILAALRQRQRVHSRVDSAVGSCLLRVPKTGLAQALRGIVQNSLDATEPDGNVEIFGKLEQKDLVLLIQDHGPGMTAEVLARAGEPFFTTKGPGSGMGLGLFLARSVVERLGGRFELQSTPASGVTARIVLPLPE